MSIQYRYRKKNLLLGTYEFPASYKITVIMYVVYMVPRYCKICCEKNCNYSCDNVNRACTQPDAGVNIINSFVAPEQGVWVTGTELLLREAVLNVVDNAIKYAPEGGHLNEPDLAPHRR